MTLTVCNLCDSGHYDSEIQSQRKTETKTFLTNFTLLFDSIDIDKNIMLYQLSKGRFCFHSARDCRELVAFVATVSRVQRQLTV